jgi:hypothetical protein
MKAVERADDVDKVCDWLSRRGDRTCPLRMMSLRNNACDLEKTRGAWAPGRQRCELGLEIAALGTGGGPGALDEDRLEPGSAFAHAIGSPPSGAPVVP